MVKEPTLTPGTLTRDPRIDLLEVRVHRLERALCDLSDFILRQVYGKDDKPSYTNVQSCMQRVEDIRNELISEHDLWNKA